MQDCFGGAHRNSGFAAGSKFNFSFEVITNQYQKHTDSDELPCFPHFWMLFGIKAEFLQAWLFLILTMSCFQDQKPFLLLSCMLPLSLPGPEISILRD